MKVRKKFKFNKVKFGILFLLFSMFVGYAALNAKLNITGTTRMAYTGDDNFRVYFSRAFINDVGKSNIINDDQQSFTFSYTDINRSDADLKYTVKNTSNLYYADVEVSCSPRKNDGTSFVYGDNDEISQNFKLEPGMSLTKDVKLLLPNSGAKVASEVENDFLSSHVKSLSKGSDSSLNFNSLTSSGVYESSNTTSGNKVYYYRGKSVNNDVVFADKCWKILRTSENGGIKLVYNGNLVGGSCTEFSASLGNVSSDAILEVDKKEEFKNNAYAGYMYGDLNASTYDEAHTNTNDSYFKKKIDEWYSNNLLNSLYEKYIIDDVYYNNRSILTDYSKVSDSNTYEGLGYGTHTALYESAGRASSIANNLAPSFKIPNKNDAFTKESSNGNGKLTYPVGMLTADELVYSGITKSNDASWLEAYNRYIITSSPLGYYNDTMNYVALGYRTLKAYPSDIASEVAYVLPVITISSDLYIVSGDGSTANPFILSSEDTYENTYTCSLDVKKVGYYEETEKVNPIYNLEVGEEYCFGEECFYTISNDHNGTVKMLAKYNLNVGRNYSDWNNYKEVTNKNNEKVLIKEDVTDRYGKQSVDAYGTKPSGGFPTTATVPYGKNETDNSYANSVVKPYVDEYKNYIEYLADGLGIDSVSAALITRDELVGLGCVVNSTSDSNCNTPDYEWVTSTTYFTMTPENGTIYIVGSDGYFKAPTTTANLTQERYRGVRPLITVKVHIPGKNPNVTFVSGNGENVGDEICIGTECFNVLNYDGTNYTLFAKYNLYTNKTCTASNNCTTNSSVSSDEVGKQNSKAIGDKNGFPTYGTMGFKDSLTAINDYSTYLNNSYNLHSTSRPISYDELINVIGCVFGYTNNGNNRGCSAAENPSVKYEWLNNTTFWGEANGSNAYLIGGDGFFGSVSSLTNDSMRGARPVVVIPASEIKDPDYVEKKTYPDEWDDNGIFSAYYGKAYDKLQTMSTKEKIGQLLVVSYTNSSPSKAQEAVTNYDVGGVLFFADAFVNKTESQVVSMISGLQAKAKIPLMLPVDEEGGTVTRIARNTNLVTNELKNYPNLFNNYTRVENGVTVTFNGFKSPSDLYKDSGNNFNLVKQETQVKNSMLKRLGLNINLAPVADVASSESFIYKRTLGQDAATTGDFVKTVIENSKNSGISHSLKHFPGYGNNADTHTSSSVDQTSLEELRNKHLIPFVAGINAGVESVLISHNIISALDKENPASLSYAVHQLLFDELGFTGLAITDDLSMGASSGITNQYIKAFTAGNHILLVSDKYSTAYNEILSAYNEGNITQNDLDQRVFKVLAWKYYMGLLS